MNTQPFWIHFTLAEVVSAKDGFDDAHTHLERAKSHVLNNKYLPAHGSLAPARSYYKQDMFGLDTFERLGATTDAEEARRILRGVGRKPGEDGIRSGHA